MNLVNGTSVWNTCKYILVRCLEKNAGQFGFSNGSNTTATDGSTFVFRSRRSSFRLYTTCGGDLDSNRKTQGQYSNHWHHFAAFSRNRCFPSFPLGGVLFSSHPPQLSFFVFQILVASRTITCKIRDRLYDCFCTKPTDKYWILFWGFV